MPVNRDLLNSIISGLNSLPKKSEIDTADNDIDLLATETTHGLMSYQDKSKLNKIDESANNYVHPTTSGYSHIPSGGSSGQILRWTSDGKAKWDKETTYSLVTTSANGLMSYTDKVNLDNAVSKLNGIESGANKYILPTAGLDTLGGVKTTSDITSSNGYTACPIIDGVPYYQGIVELPIASTTTIGGVKTTSTVTSTEGLTACPIINGVPYYSGSSSASNSVLDIDGVTPTLFAYSKPRVPYDEFEFIGAWTEVDGGIELRAAHKSLFATASHTHADYRQITKTTIQTLTTPPIVEEDYFVSNGDATFPYTYGNLSIRYGSYTGEFVAIYQTTGDDQNVWFNVYRGGWTGWRRIKDGGNADTVDGIHISVTPDGNTSNYIGVFTSHNDLHAIAPADAYVGNAGNANTLGGIVDAYHLGTLNAGGSGHGAAFRLSCQHNIYGDDRFGLKIESGYQVRVDYATNAYLASWLENQSTLVYGANGMQYFNSFGMATDGNPTVNGAPNGDWWHIIRMNHANANGYYSEIASAFHTNDVYYRRVAAGGSNGWIRLLDSNIAQSTFGRTSIPRTDTDVYQWRNTAAGTSSTPIADGTFGSYGAIYLQYS